MRRYCGAVATCLALIDVVNGVRTGGGAAWYDPATAPPRPTRWSDIVCWSHDIVSYRREESRSGRVLSLPTILAHEHGLTEQQALNHCALMLDRRIADYRAAEAPILAGAEPALLRFVADLRHWIAGNLAWSSETGRYRAN